MKPIIMIDNYDSFTFNIVQYLLEIGAEVEVFENDKITIKELTAMDFEHLILSPGAGNPDTAGICIPALAHFYKSKKILGICLGHQCIAQFFGGKIIKDEKPTHGKVSKIIHNQKGIFNGLAKNFKATRYHSLIVERSCFPEELEITAKTENGLIMGIAHKTLPIFGVQYHPEAILTEFGHELLENFVYKTAGV